MSCGAGLLKYKEEGGSGERIVPLRQFYKHVACLKNRDTAADQ